MTIELLKEQLESQEQKFSWAYNPITSELPKWIAFRESNRDYLRSIHPGGWKLNRIYRHDPLASKISAAFADFLYGEDPAIKPADLGDDELLRELLEENSFTGEVHQGVKVFSSEGEVWFRIYTDPNQTEYPLIEFHSRTQVYPYWQGRRFTAVAFVYEIARTEEEVWRYVQYHEDERVENALYLSSAVTSPFVQDRDESNLDLTRLHNLGVEQPLADQPYTADLEPEWDHGLPMLAGRFINNVPRTRKIGKSDYDGVEDLLFDLNEAHSVDSENFKLAGKKRAVMPRRYQTMAGDAEISEEIFWVEEGTDEMDPQEGPFKILEYSYDAASSIARKEDLERTVITRVGLVRQFVDTNPTDGFAQSGTALRTRLLPTALAAHGKAREWDELLPKAVCLMQQVDALDAGHGGFARQWKDAQGAPSITRASVLPEDPQDKATRHQTLIANELESIETAIDDLHPDWTPERKTLEVRRILANRDGYGLDDEGNVISVNGVGPPQPSPVRPPSLPGQPPPTPPAPPAGEPAPADPGPFGGGA
jgi:hypothetical protein